MIVDNHFRFDRSVMPDQQQRDPLRQR
jgi:hypothetical protein